METDVRVRVCMDVTVPAYIMMLYGTDPKNWPWQEMLSLMEFDIQSVYQANIMTFEEKTNA